MTMNLRSFSHDLMALYAEMGVAFADTQKRSGLGCPTGCGYCCKTPTVEATAMEMIPMALALFDQGRAEEVYDRIQFEGPETCIMYQDKGGKFGQCTQYTTRPSLCRLFGVAGFYTKTHAKELSICKELKATYPEHSSLDVFELQPAMMSDWSTRLISIHPEMLQERLPISIALGKALEKVMLYDRLDASK